MRKLSHSEEIKIAASMFLDDSYEQEDSND